MNFIHHRVTVVRYRLRMKLFIFRAKGLNSGALVGHQSEPIRSRGCERSGDAGTQNLSLIGRAATEAQLGGFVDPNRDLWLTITWMGWISRPMQRIACYTLDQISGCSNRGLSQDEKRRHLKRKAGQGWDEKNQTFGHCEGFREMKVCTETKRDIEA